jgi:aminoglycoside phosphotransferase (APT) family kinase protein
MSFQPARPRHGLPAAAVERVRELIAPGGRVVRVRPMRGGISSSVHLVHLQGAGGARQAVVVRRYGDYWQRTDPAACEREFKLLEVISRLGFPGPRPLLLDQAGGPFGAPTVVMSRLPGRPQLAPVDVSDYLAQTAQMLARLHRLPIDELGFLRDQRVNVDRDLGTFEGPAGDALQRAVWSEAAAEWPAVSRVSSQRVLVHGDYWPGNLLWRRRHLVGVVDWEQPRLGDPAKDVATCRGDVSILFGLEAGNNFLRLYEAAADIRVRNLRFWDLLISTWAVREIEDWAVVYPLLGRPDLTPALARDRIREFARAALAASND